MTIFPNAGDWENEHSFEVTGDECVCGNPTNEENSVVRCADCGKLGCQMCMKQEYGNYYCKESEG